MSKIVGWEGQYPVQAAAGIGSVDTWATFPVLLSLAGATAGGWFLGSVVGSSIRDGKAVTDADDIVPGHLPTDFQEWIATVGAAGASVLSWQLMQQMAAKFGWKTLGLYVVAMGAVTAWRKYS